LSKSCFRISPRIILILPVLISSEYLFSSRLTNFLSISIKISFLAVFNISSVKDPVPGPISNMFLFFGFAKSIVSVIFSSFIRKF
jgi:hypothetical protein